MVDSGKKINKSPQNLKKRTSNASSAMGFQLRGGNKRPIERIDILLNFLREAWMKDHDLRFGQLLYNLKAFNPEPNFNDTFNFEDNDVMLRMGIPYRDMTFFDLPNGSRMLLKDIPDDVLSDMVGDFDVPELTMTRLKEEQIFRKRALRQ